ncbi:MAG: DUF3168 domain-containing protein [Alphaproteobacteria bacterium]
MSDGANALWQAVFDALAADAGIRALLGDPPRIFEHVPDGTAFPCLVSGGGAALEAGTDTGQGTFHRLVLHVWSRARGMSEARAIMDAVHAVLHEAALLPPGRTLTYLRFDGSDVLREADGRTFHGVIRFVGRTEPSG